VAQGVAHGAGLQPQVELSNPQIGQAVAIGAMVLWHPESGQALPELLHGHAAIALLREHVAIPTAIAAATVSFLIVIFTSLCFV
jgi:hypothetical protein